MDLTALTDEELDALQLEVNVEIGARLQKKRMMDRMAGVMADASSAGVSEEFIATSFAEAKTRANIRFEPPVGVPGPTMDANSSTTPRAPRTSSGFRTNTID